MRAPAEVTATNSSLVIRPVLTPAVHRTDILSSRPPVPFGILVKSVKPIRFWSLVAIALASLAMLTKAGERALVLEINGAIGPPIADYVVRELRAAKPDAVGLVILRMNTPGGLDTSMREIVGAILASSVATYVAPSGARAVARHPLTMEQLTVSADDEYLTAD